MKLEQVASQLIGLVAAGLVEGDLQQGADIAKNATAFNRQLHPSERELAKRLAEQSDGKYSVEEIEEQLRLSSIKGTEINPSTDMVATNEDKYDDGGNWKQLGDSGYSVQVFGESNPELISYIKDNIGIYSWVGDDVKLPSYDWAYDPYSSNGLFSSGNGRFESSRSCLMVKITLLLGTVLMA
jgi:filamentous hemagglutinin